MNARLILQEYGDFVEVTKDQISKYDLDAANAKWMRLLDLPRAPFVYVATPTSLRIRAIGVAGVVRLGTLDVEIAPKFLDGDHPEWRSVFWKILLETSSSTFDSMYTKASNGADEGFADLLAEMFINSYYAGSARGLPRSYVQRQGDGPVLRGSFDHLRFVDLMRKPWRIPFMADELSEITTLTRLLRWTASKLEGLVEDAYRARVLSTISAELAHVGRIVPHVIDARRIQIGPQHRALNMAKDIGVILLEGAGLAHGSGDYRMPGFLWRSNTVYEDFIFTLCREVAAVKGLSVSKAIYHFGLVTHGAGSTLTTIPDVVFKDCNGEVFAIADAKYKKFTHKGKPVPGDTYQMIAGAQVLGCPHLSLLYPSSVDLTQTTWEICSRLGGQSISLLAVHMNLMNLAVEDGRSKLLQPILSWLSQRVVSVDPTVTQTSTPTMI